MPPSHSPVFPRRLVAACSAAAPALLLVTFLIGPSMAATGNNHLLASIAAHRHAVIAQSVLLLIATILFVPIFFGVLPLMTGRGYRLSRAAAAIFLAGFAGHAGLAFLRIALVQIGNDPDQAAMARLVQQFDHGVLTALAPLLLAFDVALILLFAALYRARLAPGWIFATMLAAALAAGLLGNSKLSFLVAAALGNIPGLWMSRTFLNTPDVDWGPPAISHPMNTQRAQAA